MKKIKPLTALTIILLTYLIIINNEFLGIDKPKTAGKKDNKKLSASIEKIYNLEKSGSENKPQLKKISPIAPIDHYKIPTAFFAITQISSNSPNLNCRGFDRMCGCCTCLS